MTRLLLLIFIVLIAVSCEESLDNSVNSNPTSILEAAWQEIDRHYPFFKYNHLNWDSVYNSHKTLIELTTTDQELSVSIGNMLDNLNDAHTNLYSPLGTFGNTHYFDQFSCNKIDDIRGYFSTYNSSSPPFIHGKVKNTNIAYIKIKTFDRDPNDYNQFDSIITNYQNTNGLIIDVRSNRGGLISNSEIIVKMLTDSTIFACKYRFRNGNSRDDFSNWKQYSISPTTNGNIFSKPITILTNRLSYSAAEWFVLSARILPNITIIGDTTGGGSGKPITRELPNGWLLRISNSQVKLPSGHDFQFTGLYPDIPISLCNEDITNNRDAILEKAISFLSSK